MKQIERLKFLQGNACFFCGDEMPVNEESIEHLVAKSNGGSNADENCVVCCTAINGALGHLSIKEKFGVALSHNQKIQCPFKTCDKSGDDQIFETTNECRSPSDGLSREAIKVMENFNKYRGTLPKKRKALVNTIIQIANKKSGSRAIETIIKELVEYKYLSLCGRGFVSYI